MQRSLWNRWIGLPHELGADPRQGKAACCLVIARILLKEAGQQTPSIDGMLQMAREGDWAGLQRLYDSLTEPLADPEELSLSLVKNGQENLGIGVVVDRDYLLLPHHRKGVIAFPIKLLKPLEYRKLKKVLA